MIEFSPQTCKNDRVHGLLSSSSSRGYNPYTSCRTRPVSRRHTGAQTGHMHLLISAAPRPRDAGEPASQMMMMMMGSSTGDGKSELASPEGGRRRHHHHTGSVKCEGAAWSSP